MIYDVLWHDIYIILLPLPTVDCTLLHFSLVLTQAVTQPLWTDLAQYKKRKLLQQQIPNIDGADKLWLSLEGKWPQAAVKVTYTLPLALRRNGTVLGRNCLWRHLFWCKVREEWCGEFSSRVTSADMNDFTRYEAEIYQLVRHKLNCARVLEVPMASNLLCFERAWISQLVCMYKLLQDCSLLCVYGL